MPKLFQINEEDLATLEALLPALAQSLVPAMTNADRAKLRRVQRILADVRWNYGPPTDISKVEPSED